MAVISQLSLEQKRREKLAQALSGQAANQPVASHMQGLAKVLAAGLGGYQQSKADKLGKEYEAERNKALQAALDPSKTREERISGLSTVPEFQDIAIKSALEKPEATDVKAMAEAAVLKSSQGQPLSAQDQAAVDAYNRIKGMEQMPDPAGSGRLFPKYNPLSLGGTPPQSATNTPQSAPQPVQPLSQPNVSIGLLPPPSGTGKPDMSMFQGGQQPAPTLTPPSGLSPKAEEQYRQAIAQSEAEKAINGGVPKMTETQSQAASRSGLINNGLRGLSEVMLKPTVSAGNMSIAKVASSLMPEGAQDVVRNNILTPDEQRFEASKGAALEGFAASVTGAGVTQDQFQRFNNILPTGSEDPQVQREKLANAYEFLLTQTKIAGPIADQIKEEAMRLRVAPEQGSVPQGGLTPQEQSEYEQLKKMFGE